PLSLHDALPIWSRSCLVFSVTAALARSTSAASRRSSSASRRVSTPAACAASSARLVSAVSLSSSRAARVASRSAARSEVLSPLLPGALSSSSRSSAARFSVRSRVERARSAASLDWRKLTARPCMTLTPSSCSVSCLPALRTLSRSAAIFRASGDSSLLPRNTYWIRRSLIDMWQTPGNKKPAEAGWSNSVLSASGREFLLRFWRHHRNEPSELTGRTGLSLCSMTPNTVDQAGYEKAYPQKKLNQNGAWHLPNPITDSAAIRAVQSPAVELRGSHDNLLGGFRSLLLICLGFRSRGFALGPLPIFGEIDSASRTFSRTSELLRHRQLMSARWPLLHMVSLPT